MIFDIDNEWKILLQSELKKPYFTTLTQFVIEEYASKTCYPERNKIFEAFRLCPFGKVKVVLLGQDPYHRPGQAQGLSFSVPEGMKLPPSLRNIFKEVMADTGCEMPKNGDLTRWAKQGVLLLNTVLTVENGKAGAHAKHGWEIFTDEVINVVSKEKNHVVFILWGNYAQRKADLIDEGKHLILQSVHPSPLSVYHGFFGNNHFSRANDFLMTYGKTPIQW